MAFSVQYWASYTEGKTKLRRHSENAVESDHVLKFLYDPEMQMVTGKVQASQRDKAYSVEAVLGSGYDVMLSKCECPMGQYECHHVAALLLYGYKNVSKTDVPMQWLRQPKSKRPRESSSMAEMFPPAKKHRSLSRPVNADDKVALHSDLSILGKSLGIKLAEGLWRKMFNLFSSQLLLQGWHWTLSREPPEVQLPTKLVEDLLMSPDFIQAEDNISWLQQALMVPRDQAQNVATLTQGQRDNTLWCALRKYRITASNFGAVIRAVRLRNFPETLKKKLTTSFQDASIRSIQWGIHHEKDALKSYEQLGFSVEPTGIWLHESGALGASPDGLVSRSTSQCENLSFQTPEARTAVPRVLEIKCPWKARETSIKSLIAEDKTFYLKCDASGNIILDSRHDYYHQVQGQLYLTNMDCGDFVVWSPRDMYIVRIVKDPSWRPNIDNMLNFYFSKFISYVTST